MMRIYVLSNFFSGLINLLSIISRSVNCVSFSYLQAMSPSRIIQVIEMLRRVTFMGLIPLMTPEPSRRAAIGLLLALCSSILYGAEHGKPKLDEPPALN